MIRKGLILLLIIFTACKKEDPLVLQPDIWLEKTTALTTEMVLIKADIQANRKINSDSYLVRWDWESDGVFDTPYSLVFQTSHQFLEPGNYQISLEVLDLYENTHSCKKSIIIAQGYSKPKPAFSIFPETGNTKTLFTLDASATADAEEETRFLTFSWDLNNDHQFDLVSRGNPIAQVSFPVARDQLIRLVVTDTSGLSAEISRELSITMKDTLVVPVVTYSPEFPTDWDTIRCDASASYYDGDPDLPLHFLFKEQNGSWKEVGDSGIYYWNRPPTGISTLRVRVLTPEDFYMEKEIPIQVTRGDRPPNAFFKRSSRFGNIHTRFFFDAWGSSDEEDMPSELKVRWDFNGDGSWDTQTSYDKYAEWTFLQPGIYQVHLQAFDSQGGQGNFSQEVQVSPFDNPTGYIYDERSDLYYGTVRVGEQWWMGENLRYNPLNDQIPGRSLTWCYDDNAVACQNTGKLYHAKSVLESWNQEFPGDRICPPGWELPTAEDWRKLINHYGFDQAGKELFYGGRSDFNALYGGYAGYQQYGADREFEMDSIYKTAVFLSTSIQGTKLHVFQLKRDSARAQERMMVLDGYYSVRCIKKE